jgi:hypothetical protein
MNFNVASQNNGILAFAGAAAASPPIDIRHHNTFGFTFRVKTDIAAAAVFKVQAAPPSAANTCLPGTFVEVPEVPICDSVAVPAALSQITIPIGTKAGSICTATLPCKPDAFIKVLPVSGDTANVEVVATLGGPR